MPSVDRREIGDSVSEVEELIGKRQESSEARVFLDWTGLDSFGQKSDARSSRMSPSDLNWLQGCVFFFLGVAASYGVNRCQNRRTNHGTSDVELSSIRVENEIATTPFDDPQSSGGDEEARSPSNLSIPVREAMASTRSPSCPGRNRLRSKTLRRRRSLLEPSAKTRKTSHSFELVAETEAPNFATRETAYSTIVVDRTPSPMSSTTAGLLRPSGGGDEALSPSHPVGDALASPGTPTCPDRKRCRSNTCRRTNAPEKRTKSPFEKSTAKDEARNVGRPEPANMIVADSSSTSMASTTAVLRRPPRRHFVPRPSREIPLVDHVDHLQASTFDGLRRRPKRSKELHAQGPFGKVKKYKGIRWRRDRNTWVAEMRLPNSKNKCFFGEFKSDLQAAFAIDAAFFYYEKRHQTNFLRSTPAMMAMLPQMPAGLNYRDRLLFVKDKVKRLAKYAADNLAGVNPSLDKIIQ